MKGPLTVRWTERALAELDGIGDRIAEGDPAAAQRHVSALLSIGADAAIQPYVGRMVPELGVHDLRERIYRTWRLVYRVRADGVDVLTVFDARRRFPGVSDPDDTP